VTRRTQGKWCLVKNGCSSIGKRGIGEKMAVPMGFEGIRRGAGGSKKRKIGGNRMGEGEEANRGSRGIRVAF